MMKKKENACGFGCKHMAQICDQPTDKPCVKFAEDEDCCDEGATECPASAKVCGGDKMKICRADNCTEEWIKNNKPEILESLKTWAIGKGMHAPESTQGTKCYELWYDKFLWEKQSDFDFKNQNNRQAELHDWKKPTN